MQIHIARGGEAHGPYSLQQVQELLATGALLAEDNAWHEGLAGWMPLRQVVDMAANEAAPSAAMATGTAQGKKTRRAGLIIGLAGVGCVAGLALLHFWLLSRTGATLAFTVSGPGAAVQEVQLNVNGRPVIWGIREQKPFLIPRESFLPPSEVKLELADRRFRAMPARMVKTRYGGKADWGTLELVYPHGQVEITSDPSGAAVTTLSGNQLGVTPLTLEKQPPGGQFLRLTKSGYIPASVQLTVEDAKTASKKISLRQGGISLSKGGKVVAWGAQDYSFGQTRIPATLNGVVAVAAGNTFSMALKQDGTVATFGGSFEENSGGAIKNGPRHPIPAGLSGVVAIAAGSSHAVALKQDGTVVAWGFNTDGECNVPTGLKDVVAIAAGYSRTVALKQDGTVVAWGNNKIGQCNVPPGLKEVVAIALGVEHTTVLKKDGTLVSWGDADYQGDVDMPEGLKDVAAVSLGMRHTSVLKRDGTVVVWGVDDTGQCAVPAGLNSVVAIAAGAYHTLALKDDGTVVAWGGKPSREGGARTSFGQATVPQGLSKVVAISAGEAHSLALWAE